MVFLDVPYSEKDEAKSMGAKWDYKEKKWYAPNDEKDLIEKWPCIEEEIKCLIGEETEFGGNLLFVDLIPRSCWFTNVRYCIEQKDWNRVRKFIYKRANFHCEICGEKGKLEGHERWLYDDKKKVQYLKRIIALCSACHETTHMGLAQVKNRGEIALKHLMKVRNWTEEAAENHVEKAFEIWRNRNMHDWELDLSIITNSGIKLARKVSTENRASISKLKINDFKDVEHKVINESENFIPNNINREEKTFIKLKEINLVENKTLWQRTLEKIKHFLKF